LRNALFAALVAAAVLGAVVPVTAQQNPNPVPGPTNLAAPPPGATGAPQLTPQPQLTAPPLPSPIATAAPSASPTPGGRHKHGSTPGPSPSGSAEATPSPPAFSSLDGDWEFVLSTPGDDIYGRLKLRQTGNTLAGTWRMERKDYPVEGSYDGKSIRLTARRDNKDWTLSGYVDGASDMVGVVDDGSGKRIVFTANHREKAKQELLIKP
jgi:hypothetical protein